MRCGIAHPFLPKTSGKILGFLGLDVESLTWTYPNPLKTQVVKSVSPLYKKIEDYEVAEQKALLGTGRKDSPIAAGAGE